MFARSRSRLSRFRSRGRRSAKPARYCKLPPLGVPDPVVDGCGADEVLNTYPELIRAAEGPVIDTACAALLLLAREVHAQGYKVALTGEGSDEWLAGYPR